MDAVGISRFPCKEFPRMRRVCDCTGSGIGLPMASIQVSPSASDNGVGAPDWMISQLHGWPACAPVNASPPALRPSTHDSGSGWLAGPFPCDSCIHDSLPVCPGALSVLRALTASACARRSKGRMALRSRKKRHDGYPGWLPSLPTSSKNRDLRAIRRKDQRGLRESRRLLFLMGTDERKSCRGDKTAVELFLAGVRDWGLDCGDSSRVVE